MDFFQGACREKSLWRIGLEAECFLFFPTPHGLRRLPYDHPHDPCVQDVLKDFEARGWRLSTTTGQEFKALEAQGAFLTLEPGGQIEFSSPPVSTLHGLAAHFQTYLQTLESICAHRGILPLSLGFDPLTSLADVPWIPKERYRAMGMRMPEVGQHGLEMMGQTCTTQVSLDYACEQDMVGKLRLSLKLQPLITALCANSPFKQGRDTGLQSYRSFVWTDVDPDRCGMLPFMFEASAGFGAYIHFLQGVVPYGFDPQKPGVLQRRPFAALMENASPPLGYGDWQAQAGMVFPEVRLKPYLEMRGADAGPPALSLALAAFWVGVLYDEETYLLLSELTRGWSVQELLFLRSRVPQEGLGASIGGKNLGVWGEHMFPLIRQGLERRGQEEAMYLAPLEEILRSRCTPADRLRERVTETGTLDEALHSLPPL
jgi:glutamate--cysteine ligase